MRLEKHGQREGGKAAVFQENTQCLSKSLGRQHISSVLEALTERAGDHRDSLSSHGIFSSLLPLTHEMTCTAAFLQSSVPSLTMPWTHDSLCLVVLHLRATIRAT